MKYSILFTFVFTCGLLSGWPGSFQVARASMAGPTVDLRAVDDTGISNTDNITFRSTLAFDISGGTPGATVELLRNGQPVASSVAATGPMTLTDTALSENGTYNYSAREIIGGITGQSGATVSVVFDNVRPGVMVGRAAGQVTPTRTQPIGFDIVFSEEVFGFEGSDVDVGGNIVGLDDVSVAIDGGEAVYRAAISDIPSDGSISVSVADASATDTAGNESTLSISYDNLVRLDQTSPSLTIDLANGQPSSTRLLPVRFLISFNEPVTGFSLSDISFQGSTADFSSLSMSLAGSGATYNLSVSGISSNGGFVAISVPAAAAKDFAGNASLASTGSSPAVAVDNVAPSVTVDQAPDQADPATGFPIRFKVVFSEPVTDFTADRLWFAGSTVSFSTANKTITGSGTTYTVAISNLTPADGVLKLSLITGAALDLFGNPSVPSTSTDNVVQLDLAATDISLSGRVTTAAGVPVRAATVILSGPTGGSTRVLTNSLGYYTFNNIAPGMVYSVQVLSRRYRFTSRVVEVGSAAVTDIDFIAEE